MVILANKTVIGVGVIDGAIHEAVGQGLLDKCQILNDCETGKCKVILDYKLLAKHVFHNLRLTDKNEQKLNDCCKSFTEGFCLSFKFLTFHSGAISISGFNPRKAAKMALVIVRLWLESNQSSIEYFSVPKYHLTNIYLKENSNIDCVVDVKGYEVIN